tara:strand:- start:2515 stop:3012 length:498 start_codon:yes stop_codon:yes gene_type:complete
VKPKSILFVCLGNICRSPVAQGVFQDVLTHKIGLSISKKWTIDSAGTSKYHNGESPDHRSQNSTILHGVDISNQKSRHFTSTDFKMFDFIFVMDAMNYSNVLKLSENDSERSKVHFFLDSSFPNQNRQVQDPYLGGSYGFENVYQIVKKASENWLERWGSVKDKL